MSAQNGKDGHHTNGLFMGVAICFCLGLVVCYIFSYVFCRRHIGHHPSAATAAGLRGLNLSDIASLPSFAHRKSSVSLCNGSIDDLETGSSTSSSSSSSAAAAAAAVAVLAEAEMECSVCLSFVEEGEMVRLLPNCMHVFHMDCIDKWFQSNTTCPVCRADVRQPAAAKKAVATTEMPPELQLDSLASIPDHPV